MLENYTCGTEFVEPDSTSSSQVVKLMFDWWDCCLYFEGCSGCCFECYTDKPKSTILDFFKRTKLFLQAFPLNRTSVENFNCDTRYI